MGLIKDKSPELCFGERLGKRDGSLSAVVSVRTIARWLEQKVSRVTVLLGFYSLRLFVRFASRRRATPDKLRLSETQDFSIP